jgi:hypothetical protein
MARSRARFGGDEKPPAQFTLRMGIILGLLTIAGAIWGAGSKDGSLRYMVLEDHAFMLRLAAAVESNAAATGVLAVAVGTVQGNLAGRTTALEAKADRNWTAIRRQGTQSEKNKADISHFDTRQQQQATQQTVDRVTASEANLTQSKRADQSDNRQAAAATAAITAESTLSNRLDQDRHVAATASQALEVRQDKAEEQQDTDRAAAKQRKK